MVREVITIIVVFLALGGFFSLLYYETPKILDALDKLLDWANRKNTF